MSLCVVSARYEKVHLSKILEESCERAQVPLFFVEAAAFAGAWRGSMKIGKMSAVLEALPRLKQLGWTHVLWADAFDSFIQSDARNIMGRYGKLGSPGILFSGEKNCWPDADMANSYPPSTSPYRFINAGTWMGEVEYLLGSIDVALSRFPNEQDDQRIWTQMFVRGMLPGAKIDVDREVFQTMWGTKREEAREDACVIHHNGGDWREHDSFYSRHWAEIK